MSYLTLKQRYAIAVMYQNGKKKSEIATTIGKDKSVITRKFQRNCDKRNGKYDSELAQRKCQKRHLEKPKKILLTTAVKEYIDKKLEVKYSPEQIVGTAKKEGVSCVSAERIYQYIWQDKKGKEKCTFDLIIPYGIHNKTWSPINVSKTLTLKIGVEHFQQNSGGLNYHSMHKRSCCPQKLAH